MSYDAFATTFSQSRKNLKWGEIGYFIEFIKKNSGDKNTSILDVGCGNGRFLETLKASELPYSYLGIDESIRMIEEARKIHPENNFEVSDMTRIHELSDRKKYDIIVFIASFHHLHTEQERKEVLEKTKKLLTPGGVLMMTNWNLIQEPLFSKYDKSYRGNGDFNIKIGIHERYYHGFSVDELAQLFRESGYKVQENRVFEEGKNIVSIIQTIF